jgi:L-ornithine N5-oxygenase
VLPGGSGEELALMDAYDVVGVGFGPSNLALAIAVTEHNARARPDDVVTARFVERQPHFGWHRGMLLRDATMQVSFLKDLVTLRDPTSEFTFLAYLHDRGRLVDFINHKSLFPLRVEFHDYLEWAAAKVSHLVTWGADAVACELPVGTAPGGDASGDGAPGGPEAETVDVVARPVDGGADVRLRARNVVLGTGLVPRLPDGVTRGDRVWHNHELLPRVAALGRSLRNPRPDRPARFVVVGAGQSAAEVTAFLHESFPAAEVCSVFSRYGYSPADDSPFANRIFDPDAVDEFYGSPDAVRRQLLGYHGNTNYSVVDTELIEALYRRAYTERVAGDERLRFLHASRVAELADDGERVHVTIEALTSGQRTTLAADAVVYATGYHAPDPFPLLGDLAPLCRRDAAGRPDVDRDYRLRAPELGCGVYLQGGTEHTHGLSSSLLSNAAVRAGEILDSVLARRSAAALVATPVAAAAR